MSGMNFLLAKKKKALAEMEEDGEDALLNPELTAEMDTPAIANEREPSESLDVEEDEDMDEEGDEGDEEAPVIPREPPSQNSKLPQSTDEDALLEQKLKEFLGEDEWEYLDDGERRRYLALMKATSAVGKDIGEQIDMAFRARSDRKQSNRFLKQINQHLEQYQTDFIALANNKKFEKWIQESRKRLSIFESSLAHKDKEGLEDLRALMDEFYQSSVGNYKGNSPRISKGNPSRSRSQEPMIDEETYQKAVKDLRQPLKREKARSIIEQYQKQQIKE